MCSRDVKVAGLLGSAASLEAKSSAVAEQQVGLGGTTKWRLASLVSHATITYSFTAVGGCLGVYAMRISSHHRLAEGLFCRKSLTLQSVLCLHILDQQEYRLCVLFVQYIMGRHMLTDWANSSGFQAQPGLQAIRRQHHMTCLLSLLQPIGITHSSCIRKVSQPCRFLPNTGTSCSSAGGQATPKPQANNQTLNASLVLLDTHCNSAMICRISPRLWECSLRS